MEGLCNHPDFDATVLVTRLEHTLSYVAEVKIHCIVCGMPFRFKDLPAGISVTKSMCSIFGNEASLPISPMDDMPQDKWETLH